MLIAEKYAELQQDRKLYFILIDFKKAFERVCHEVMWRNLYHYGLQPKLIKLQEDLYKRAQSAVIAGQDITEQFKYRVDDIGIITDILNKRKHFSIAWTRKVFTFMVQSRDQRRKDCVAPNQQCRRANRGSNFDQRGPLKKVKRFKFLGSFITANGDCMQDI